MDTDENKTAGSDGQHLNPIPPPPPGHNLSAAKLRKRTKTGCLTCRRRRIKCGEERPICGNCIKSKRQCEGYHQRIVFKTPIDGWSGVMGPASTIPYHTSTIPGAPRRPSWGAEYNQFVELTPGQPQYGIPIDEHARPIQIPNHLGGLDWPAPPPQQYPLPQFAPTLPSNAMGSVPPTPTSLLPPPSGGSLSSDVPTPSPLSNQFYHRSPNFDSPYAPLPMQTSLPTRPGATMYDPQTGARNTLPTPPATTTYTENGSRLTGQPFVDRDSSYFSQNNPNTAYMPPDPIAHSRSDQMQSFGQKPGISRTFSGAPISTHTLVSPSPLASAFISAASPFNLSAAAVEWHSKPYVEIDDYDSPWNSDEEEELTPEQALIHGEENGKTLAMIMHLHKSHSGDTSIRDYSTFLYHGLLTHYEADRYASPLNNPQTARVFAHFLSATAPSLSIFERQPRNSSPLFSDSPTQNAQEGLWTYTLPVMALNHQGLLHAMLSLSSLHISKLQNEHSTPAFQHYAYAIKRINRCVEHPAKRHNPTTLAATLLLGFYEVMTADHSKWCCHLAGAARLLQEINYRDMSAYARMEREQQIGQESNGYNHTDPASQFNQSRRASAGMNEDLIFKISGRRPEKHQPLKMDPASYNKDKYQLYQDLFWWYARQDTYQSVIAGNRLMLNYHRWLDCPPRAEMGRVDAIYGTHDHLFLIFGRIADFAAKDRERKLKVIAANGGRWQPHPDLQMGPPPSASQQGTGRPAQGPPPGGMQPPGPPHQGTPPAMPSFFGMAPMPTNITVPAPYASNMYSPPYQSPTSSERSFMDLDTQTQMAVSEWNQIYTALQDMEAYFGPGFQPLEPDLYPFSTPFGQAIVYPSYDIAVMWALYYAVHIIALRGHPHMPPFAHVASGVAAQKTAKYSELIGRIAAGMISEDSLRHPLSPAVGSTYCEISMPIFVAAIQYTEAEQRKWVVHRMRAIESLTGWASIGMIAQGCETAWEKAGAAKRGPPYVRTIPLDDRLTDISAVSVPRKYRAAGQPIVEKESAIQWQAAHRTAQTDSRGARVYYAMGFLSEEGDVDIEQESLLEQQRLDNQESALHRPSQLQPSPFS